jgi:hypothetical protein
MSDCFRCIVSRVQRNIIVLEKYGRRKLPQRLQTTLQCCMLRTLAVEFDGVKRRDLVHADEKCGGQMGKA